MTIESKFSELATIDRTDCAFSYDDVLEKLTELCEEINATETDEFIWSLGELGAFTLDSLLIGAYWHLTEWHDGQDSLSYACMCAVGSIFDPGMSDGPEEDSSEQHVYNLLEELAQ